MFSQDNAYMLLSALQANPTDTVRLDYEMYRRRFSVTQVPAIRAIKDREGNPQFVEVDKRKAIDFLKRQHQFITKAEMVEELNDAASDFSRIDQRE